MEVVSWWMLDLVRATYGDKFTSYCITCRTVTPVIMYFW